MDEKIMDDFDSDFINDILIASDDFQIADTFLDDFMGELNNNNNTNQIPIQTNNNNTNNIEWSHLTNIQVPDQSPLLIEPQPQDQLQEVQLMPNNIQQHQQTNFNQPTIVLQPISNLYNNSDQNHFNNLISQLSNQSDLNTLGNVQMQSQPPDLNTFQNFNSQNEISIMLSNETNAYNQTTNSIIPVINNDQTDQQMPIVNLTQQNPKVKRSHKNLRNILKDDQNRTGAQNQNFFNFDGINKDGNYPSVGIKKQKSRSINSIINDPNPSMNIKLQNNQQIFNLPTSMASPECEFLTNYQTVEACLDTPHFIIDQNLINDLNMELTDVNKVDNSLKDSLKATKQVRHLKSVSSSPMKENTDLNEPFKLLDTSEITPIKKTGKMGKKKTSHNAIEKKYRSSINDKINELKNRVAGPSAKLQKSGILKRALEYLTNIEEVNSKLCVENKMLRSALKKISLNTTDMDAITDVLRSVNYSTQAKTVEIESSINPNTPPNSSSSCDSDSYYSNFDSESSPSSISSMLSAPNSPITPKSIDTTKKPQKRTYTKKAKKENMVERSRIMLCMFAMSILFFNPFNLILSTDNSLGQSGSQFHSNKPINSRVLNSIDLDTFNSSENTTILNTTKLNTICILSWFLNLILISFCLVKVYKSGDPYIDTDSYKSDFFWSCYQKSCRAFQKKNYTEANEWLKTGLKELGQKGPETKIDLCLGITWQLIRLILDKLYIGKLLQKISTSENHTMAYKLSSLFYFELHKFAYLNNESKKDSLVKTTTLNHSVLSTNSLARTSMYSYLTGIYYLLATYNMSQVYVDTEITARTKYNLCEMYFSMILFLKFFLPMHISNWLVKHLVNQNVFQTRIGQTIENRVCKLQKLETLLSRNVFIEFLKEFDVKFNLDLDDRDIRHKTLNLISYKRKLFATMAFLYDSDDSHNEFDLNGNSRSMSSVSANGVACDYILHKFQEYLLFKMTGQIINQAGLISADRMSSSSSSLNCSGEDDEQNEMADVDQTRFDSLMVLYEENLDYFMYSKSRFSGAVIQETQFTLVTFLSMMNGWKLRRFDQDICVERLKNSCNSEFIESIRSVLSAYKCIVNEPEAAFGHCTDAVESLQKFIDTSSMHNKSNHLIEKFELLINDWILSAQTYMWTNKKMHDINLFNKTLKNFKNCIVNFPELNYKARMYETVIMFTSNRNPINLLNPTAKQTIFSNCNQEAFYSMNKILKNFQLQITE